MCKYIATHQFDFEHVKVYGEGSTPDEAIEDLISSAYFLEDVEELLDGDPEIAHIDVRAFKKLTPESDGWDEFVMTEFEWYLGKEVEARTFGTEGLRLV